MTQTASEGWLKVAAKFWTARRETPTSEIEDMADFGALVAKVTREMSKAYWSDTSDIEPTEENLLAALKREIGAL